MKRQLLTIFVAVLAVGIYFGFKALSQTSGEISAEFAVFSFSKDRLKPIIPPELDFVSQSLTLEKDFHPLLFIFGRQKKVQSDFINYSPIDYYEHSFIIPYLKFKDKRPGVFSYVVQTFVSEENGTIPLYVGWLMGYNKHFTNMKETLHRTENIYEITTPGTQYTLTKLFYLHQNETLPVLNLKNFHRMKEFLQQPILGRTPWGTLVSSKLTYDFDNAIGADFKKGSVTFGPNYYPMFTSEKRIIEKGIYPLSELPKLLGAPTPKYLETDVVGFFMEAKWTLSEPWGGINK